MTGALVDAVGDRPLPLAVTAAAEHVIVRAQHGGPEPARRRRRTAGLCALPHPPCSPRSTPPTTRRPGAAAIAGPDLDVGCVPCRRGAAAPRRPRTLRRSVAHRGAAAARRALSVAANPAAVAFLVSTTAARLLGAERAGVFSRTDGGVADRPARQRVAQEPPGRSPTWRSGAGTPAVGRGAHGRPGLAGERRAVAAPVPRHGGRGTASGFQATACLPMRVEDRDLGALVFSFLVRRGLLGADEREYLTGGRGAVRPGAGPRPAARRRAGRPRRC